MFERGFEFAPGYRLETFLGRGQFGQVWRATAPGGTLQAVKFVDLADGQWEKEYAGIQRVKQIRHPNLMPILAIWLLGNDGKALHESLADKTLVAESAGSPKTAGADGGRLDGGTLKVDWLNDHSGRWQARWMVVSMLLGGKNLQQRLQECVEAGSAGIPPKELLVLMDECAKGLDYLNSPSSLPWDAGSLQHCDIKPANIVLVGSSAVVCDFGLARIMAREQVTASSICGTPAYMAPETIGGKPSRNSDQYSLAITYYQLRTGSLPLADGTVWQILEAHRQGTLHFDGVSKLEQQVLRRATALQWDQRFPSNGEMVEALREALRLIDGEPPTRRSAAPFRNRWAAVAVAACATVATWIWRDTDSAVDRPNATASGPIDVLDTQATKLSRVWREMLEAGLSEPETTAPQFRLLLGQYAALEHPLPIPLIGHQRDVQQVHWVPGASQVATDSPMVLLTQAEDPYVMAFDMATLDEMVLDAGMRRLEAADASGSQVVALGPPGQQLLNHSRFVSALALSPDLQWAASGGSADGLVQVWPIDHDEPNDQAVLRFEGRDVTATLWHPTGDYLLVADGDGDVHLVRSVPQWRAGIQPKIVSFSLPRAVQQWAFDRRGETLVVLDVDQHLSTFSWNDCERLLLDGRAPEPKRLSTPGSIVRRFTVTSSDSGEPQVIAAGDASELSFYTLTANVLIDRLDVIGQGPVICFAAAGSADSQIIISGGERGQLTLHRSGTKQVVVLPGHGDTVTDVSLSPDGRWLASVSRDGMSTLRRVDQHPEQFIEFRDRDPSPLTLVSWHPSGRWLITGGHDGQLMLWDARHLRLLVHCCSRTEPSAVDQPPQQPVPSLARPIQLSGHASALTTPLM